MKYKILLKILGICLLTLLAYAPSLNNDFVWEDKEHISLNIKTKHVSELKDIWFDLDNNYQYYPLTTTSLWIEKRIWQYNPQGYHATNIGLHLINAVLIALLLSRLGVDCAFFIAIIFAVHPVHVESVAWIMERKNVLSGLFYLLSLHAYLSFKPLGQRDVTHTGQKKYYLLSLLFFILALLSKTVTATLPAVLMLLIWWKKDKWTGTDLRALTPFFLIGLCSGLITIWLERTSVGAEGIGWNLSLTERCLIAGRALWFYAAKLIWPVDLTFFYPRWNIDATDLLSYLYPLTAALCLILILILQRRKLIGKAPLVAVLFFIITLFPALGFFNVYPFKFSFVADHFQYLASIGLLALYVNIINQAIKRFVSFPTKGTSVPGMLIIALCVLLTRNQCRIYHNDETLYKDILRKNPQCLIAQNNLGVFLRQEGRLDEAIEAFQNAIKIDPGHNKSYLNLGATLAEKGEIDEAYAILKKVTGDK